jgi:hypothetical protein
MFQERSLQNITNYFIVSLAVADLLVAGVVMPFYTYTLVGLILEYTKFILYIEVLFCVANSFYTFKSFDLSYFFFKFIFLFFCWCYSTPSN